MLALGPTMPELTFSTIRKMPRVAAAEWRDSAPELRDRTFLRCEPAGGDSPRRFRGQASSECPVRGSGFRPQDPVTSYADHFERITDYKSRGGGGSGTGPSTEGRPTARHEILEMPVIESRGVGRISQCHAAAAGQSNKCIFLRVSLQQAFQLAPQFVKGGFAAKMGL